MSELVSPARWRFEVRLFIRKTGQITRQIEELLGNQVDHLPFPLNPAVDRHHRRAENHPPALLEKAWPDNNITRSSHPRELLEQVLLEVDENQDLVDEVLEVTAEDDETFHIRRYAVPQNNQESLSR
ncbi:hypothetical protein J2Z75_005169 [Rhizobium herbae]|uniref:DUF1902 domain-containing protein n=1 Tax=Rhizobium herbae TaxID=508661 RepID=A0ABS4EUK8_9HYPH|nr:hypothetical protein [Rhizobium herbae]